MRLANKICIISFFSLGLCFVVSETLLKQALHYSTTHLKYESLRIFEFCSHLASLILWNLACLLDPFCICHLCSKSAQVCFLNQSCFPLACEVFWVQKSLESSDTWLKTWQRPWILPTNIISLPRKGNVMPLLNRNLLSSIQNKHHALGEDEDIDPILLL